MTQDDVLKLAAEAELWDPRDTPNDAPWTELAPALEKFAGLVLADHAASQPGYRLNTAKTAAVAPAIKYLPIDENTPKGVRMILADKSQGIGYIREHQDNDGFTHWHPLPVWDK